MFGIPPAEKRILSFTSYLRSPPYLNGMPAYLIRLFAPDLLGIRFSFILPCRPSF